MIESYSFGRIMIDGRPYTRDVLLFPDGKVLCPWWRETGHRLVLSDMDELVRAEPEEIIIGTGSPGMMRPGPGLCSDLESRGIAVKVYPTGRAVAEYNDRAGSGVRLGAGFHLTC